MPRAEYLTTCKRCGKQVVIVAKVRDMQRWKDGAPIGEAMPYLTPDERGILLGGYCEDCWDTVWSEGNLGLIPDPREEG